MAVRHTMIIGDISAATSRQVAEAFQAQGFRVLAPCYDGLSLVEAGVEHRPAVVSLDLILPKLTGLQVIEALRRKDVNPTFIVVSAVSSRERVVAAQRAGAAFYLLKPIDNARLVQVAARVASEVAHGRIGRGE